MMYLKAGALTRFLFALSVSVLFLAKLPAEGETIRWEDLSLLSPDGTYLGSCNPSVYESKSILNTYGDYGSQYSSKSIHNSYGNYGSKYSDYSPYNSLAGHPPLIMYGGTPLTKLTRNRNVEGGIDPDIFLALIKSRPEGFSAAQPVSVSKSAPKNSATNRIDKLASTLRIRRIGASDLQGFSARHLTLVRNAVYARYGRIFQDSELKAYFSKQPWYRPNSEYRDSMLSETERKNTEFIMQYQKNRGLEW